MTIHAVPVAALISRLYHAEPGRWRDGRSGRTPHLGGQKALSGTLVIDRMLGRYTGCGHPSDRLRLSISLRELTQYSGASIRGGLFTLSRITSQIEWDERHAVDGAGELVW